MFRRPIRDPGAATAPRHAAHPVTELRRSAAASLREAAHVIDDRDALTEFLLSGRPDPASSTPDHRLQLARLAGRYAAAAAARSSAECDESPETQTRLATSLRHVERGLAQALHDIQHGYAVTSPTDALAESDPGRVVDSPWRVTLLLLSARQLIVASMQPTIDTEAVLAAHQLLGAAMNRVLLHIAEEQEQPAPFLYDRPGRTAAHGVATFAEAAAGSIPMDENRLSLIVAGVPLWLHATLNDIDVRHGSERLVTTAASAWVSAGANIAITEDRRRDLLLHLVDALAHLAGECWDHARQDDKQPDLVAYAIGELKPLAVEALLQHAVTAGHLAPADLAGRRGALAVEGHLRSPSATTSRFCLQRDHVDTHARSRYPSGR